MSYRHLAAAINRVAWWINTSVDSAEGTESLGYIGPSDLRYTILTIAAQKAGFKVIYLNFALIVANGCDQAFFPSPRSGVDAYQELFETADCRNVFTASTIPPGLEDVFARLNVHHTSMLSFR